MINVLVLGVDTDVFDSDDSLLGRKAGNFPELFKNEDNIIGIIFECGH